MKKVLGAPNTDKLLLLMHKNFQFLATATTTATTVSSFSDSQKVKFNKYQVVVVVFEATRYTSPLNSIQLKLKSL